MTKEEALQAIKLLSALESWAFSQSARLPDYLVEDIQRSMEVLERILLDAPQEKYTYGTPLMDAMTKDHVPPQRPWVNMTEDEVDQGLLRTNYAMKTAEAWRHGVEWAQFNLMRKNT